MTSLRHTALFTLGLMLAPGAFAALPSSGVNASSPLYDYVDNLEALGCGYATYRLFRPQTYADMRSAVDVQEGDPESGQVCRIPRWLRKEKEILRLRATQLPFIRFQTLALGDEIVTVRGVDATVSPSFPLWDRRIIGSGLMSYLDFSMQMEAGNENFGFSFGGTPSLGFSILDTVGTKFRFYLYEAFAKVNYGWAELEIAKLQLRFGSAAHGNLLLSGATAPISFVRFGLRPHVLGFLGPATFQTFVTTETGAVSTSGAHLIGFHIGFRPATWFEFGLLELYQFGGPQAPGLQALDILKLPFYVSSADMNKRRQKMLSTEFGLRPWKEAHLYSQLAFDSLNGFDQLGNDLSLLFGLNVRLAQFGFRVEYVSTAASAYQAANWKSGLVYDGTPIGHPIGPDGDGLYLDLYLPDLAEFRPSLGVFREKRGASLATTATAATDDRKGVTLGIKKRWVKTEIEFEGKYSDSNNGQNKTGANHSVGAGRFVLRYSFL